MRYLALTTRPLHSRGSGYDVRVTDLCSELRGEVHHVVAPYQPPGTSRPGLRLDGVFASSEELAPLVTERLPVSRHLRRSNRRFLARTRPDALAAGRARLAEIVRERAITHVLVFGGEIAELARDLQGPGGPVTVLDVCDSAALTSHRERPAGRRPRGPRDGVRRLAGLLDETRKRRTERRFVHDFDLVTAISDADARAVEGRGPNHVRVVPNGLDEAYAAPLAPPGERRGVVFWGNLAFGPNQDALRLLLDAVHPRLRAAGVELCVVGGGAPQWVADRAAGDPTITLTGFVDDLPAVVARYPIMINPMVSGSGLKNKVLEAFGLGLVVVSTPLGVEALPPVADGLHLACAEDGDGLGDLVLALLDDPARRERLRTAAHALVHEHYLWPAVGRTWRALLPAAR